MRQLTVKRTAEYGIGMAMALLVFSGPTLALGGDTSGFHALGEVDVREEMTDTQLAEVQGGQVGTFTVQGQREFTLPGDGDINVSCTPSCVVTIQSGGATITSTSSAASNMVRTFSNSGTSHVNISSTVSVGR
ncbi:hypothetical protein [Nitrospira sp. Nam74]